MTSSGRAPDRSISTHILAKEVYFPLLVASEALTKRPNLFPMADMIQFASNQEVENRVLPKLGPK
jgi:hypothetical protein